MRALPLCGNKAFSNSAESGLRFSTALMARARARGSPERRRSIQGCRWSFKLFSVKQPATVRKTDSLSQTNIAWVPLRGPATISAMPDPGNARLDRVLEQLRLYEHPLMNFDARPKGEGVEVSIQLMPCTVPVHTYVYELHPRDLDHPQ